MDTARVLSPPDLETSLGVDSLHLIKENAYCRIYRALSSDGPLIVKTYKGGDPSLARAEAAAIDRYHEFARTRPELLDSRTIRIDEARNIICIQFVPGECSSGLLYRSRRSPEALRASVSFAHVLGTLLSSFRETSARRGGATSPFIFEYLAYASKRLEGIPLLGQTLFRGFSAEAERLSGDLARSGEAPSFIHGDFVPRNIHVQDDRVGLIDFANTIDASHTLNDAYNFRRALRGMFLPREARKKILSGFWDGLGNPEFPECVHRFYHEYHRRRWLMLKLKASGPKDRLHAFLGLLGFARAYRPGEFAG
jgi:Ser/Thr protein kinase RdoA (MazF antagonist)